MNNLLSAYFQRLLKSRLYWCLLGLMILSGIIIPILAHREMIAYGTDYTLESRLVWHFLIIGFIVAIFCSWFLGTDYSDGTIRNKIIAGNSRLKIYISALLICVIASVILVVAHQITIIGLGTWLIAPFKTDVHTISLIIGISILATITFAGINTMIVMINQNKASSSIICLVVSLLMFGISFYVLSVLFSSDMAHSDSIVKQIYEFLNIFLPTGQLLNLINLQITQAGKMIIYYILNDKYSIILPLISQLVKCPFSIGISHLPVLLILLNESLPLRTFPFGVHFL